MQVISKVGGDSYDITWHVQNIISEGLRPLPPAPKLEDPMIGRLKNSMDG